MTSYPRNRKLNYIKDPSLAFVRNFAMAQAKEGLKLSDICYALRDRYTKLGSQEIFGIASWAYDKCIADLTSMAQELKG